ncbi:MAG: hypothetical protein IJ703_10340 [Eubacterium sp.]|nr:hypothetical protein [Eubacterium sp.]
MSTDNGNKNVTMDINDAIDNIFDDNASSAGSKFQKKAEDTVAKAVDASTLTGEEGTTVLSEDILTGEEGTTVLSKEELMGMDLSGEPKLQGGFQPVSGPIPQGGAAGFQPVNGPIPQNGPAGFQPVNGPIPQAGAVPPVPPQGAPKAPNIPVPPQGAPVPPQQIPNFQPKNGPVPPQGVPQGAKATVPPQGVPQQIPNFQPRPTGNNAPVPPQAQNAQAPGAPVPPQGIPQAPQGGFPGAPVQNGQPQQAPGVIPGSLPGAMAPASMNGAFPPAQQGKKVKEKKVKENKVKDPESEGKGMKVFGLVSMCLAIAGLIAVGVLLALNLFFSDYTKNYKGSADKGVTTVQSGYQETDDTPDTPDDTEESSVDDEE